MRSVVVILLFAMAVGVTVVACSGGGENESPNPATETNIPALTQMPDQTPSAPVGAPPGLRGFIFPVEGACLPGNDDLMPGAEREYRGGTHEGIDFYDSDNCVSMGEGTEILASKPGTITRADLEYKDLSQEEVDDLFELVEQGQGGDAVVQDKFRGRQVWIDHGSRIETHYAHLSGIPDNIFVGQQVEQGQVIGFMGESGVPEAVDAPGVQLHLHFEIRVWNGYIGQGRPTAAVRTLYETALAP